MKIFTTRPVLLCGMLSIFLASCGTDVAERNNAANWYTQNGQYDNAVQAYRVAQVTAPDNAQLYLNAAQALENNGDIEQAIQTLEQAILRGDSQTQQNAHYNLGNLYFRQARYDEAVNAYQEALLLNANDADARFNLELALQNASKPTPTPIEMQSQPQLGQANASATPSPNPAGMQPPTPTPSPPPDQPIASTPKESGDTGERVENDLATPNPDEKGELTIEKALDILEETEHQQQNIGRLRPPTLVPSTPVSGKDW
jgi:tetratricopeptide (TPR) repeat protein